jgi:hypothetical protein
MQATTWKRHILRRGIVISILFLLVTVIFLKWTTNYSGHPTEDSLDNLEDYKTEVAFNQAVCQEDK